MKAATFRVTGKQNNKRLFTPVNKRAKKLAAAAGETITITNLKALKGISGYRILESPSLRKIV